MPDYRFEPWVGSSYGSFRGTGLRLLVLGESHYIEDLEWDRPSFTREVIENCTQRSRRDRFFSVLTSLLLQRRDWDLDERAALWRQLAFYNYIQWPVGPKARIRPREEMWGDSAEFLRRLLDDQKPDRILVCGRGLWSRLPAPDTTATFHGENIPSQELRQYGNGVAMGITHPSAPRFSYRIDQPVVDRLMSTDADTRLALAKVPEKLGARTIA